MAVADGHDHAVALLAIGPTLALVDENFGGNHAGLDMARSLAAASPSSAVAVMTYDRSIDARMRASAVSTLMLYKPVSADLLAVATRMALRR